MRSLLPVASDEVDLHAWYAAGWVEAGGLRLNFVSSADGAATTDGLSGGLQTPGDNTVFAALRDLADVVVVGSGTVAAENYRPIRVSPERRTRRRQYGLAETLPTAVVSASLRLDPTADLFTCTQPRTIVITGTRGDAAALASLQRTCDVIVAGDDVVDFAAARRQLEARGLRRILAEGGPTMFGEWGAAGVANELCLSITPKLAGPGSRRIVTGGPWAEAPVSVELAGLLEEGGALFCRYRFPRTQ